MGDEPRKVALITHSTVGLDLARLAAATLIHNMPVTIVADRYMPDYTAPPSPDPFDMPLLYRERREYRDESQRDRMAHARLRLLGRSNRKLPDGPTKKRAKAKAARKARKRNRK